MAQEKDKPQLPSLSEGERAVLNACIELRKTYGDQKPPMKEVVRLTGKKKSTVGTFIHILKAKGYLKERWEVIPA